MGKSVHDTQIMPRHLLISKIKGLETQHYKRDRALLSCLELGGFRISEVLGITYREKLRMLRRLLKCCKQRIKKETDKKKLKYYLKRKEALIKEGKAIKVKLEKEGNLYYVDPLRKYNLKKLVIKGKDGKDYKFLQFENVTILKRREKVRPKKSPPLPYHKEKELIDLLWSYAKELPQEDSILFPMTDRTALTIVKKALGPTFFLHYLRHLRITRLKSNDYDFTDTQVQLFIGSKDIRSLQPYSHLGTQDLREKMI